ncbi:MAG: MBOAT family O-acyltransferase [Clostridiaceae bacterium]|nr:MBOAT family O-acyltransferase [Clostridiaceae bacterium]
MIFASLLFLYLFLPLNLIIYFSCKNIKARNLVLLGFSLFFYAWGEPLWIFVLILTALVDYMCGLLIEQNRGTPRAKVGLVISLVTNLGLLATAKYAGFFIGSLNAVLPFTLPVPSIALPLGISFYTFQTLSYVIDVYRGNVAAQRKYPDYLMYLSLYPQLVAGPIVRYATVAAEIDDRRSTPEDTAYGLFRFCIGLGKKVILANTAGALCSQFLDSDLAALSTVGAWLGVILFALQIYFDFAGYSDMAIGLGRIFGFHYYENFNYPYISRSAAEFWRRWHISLGTFFRDYVYIPLGGNRRHVYANLAVVWFLTGLWHGASWNFILWGLWFGFFIAMERLFLGKFLQRIPRVFSHLYTLLIVLIGWVLFYFTDLSSAFTVLGRMFGVGGTFGLDAISGARMMNYIFFLTAAVLGCLPIFPRIREVLTERRSPAYAPGAMIAWELILCVVLLVACTALLVGESYNPFLYFRF